MSKNLRITLKSNTALYCIFAILSAGLLACTNDDDCGSAAGWGNTAEIVELTWKNTRVQIDTFPRIYYRFNEIEEDSLIFNDYAIQVVPFMNYYNAQYIPPTTFSIVPTAYACSFIPPLAEEILLNIQITSDKSMDDEHPAGVNINNFFDINVSDFRNDINSGIFDLEDYIQINRRLPEEIALLLKSAPPQDNFYSFTVKVFTDGREDKFEFTTSPVYLLLYPAE